MTEIVFTKLEHNGDERDLGAVSVASGATVVDDAVASLYDWRQVTDEASLRQAFDYIERRVAGRYLYAYWRAPGPDGQKERRYAAVYAPSEAAKHAGPGPHPGTGTPQSVHGGGGGGAPAKRPGTFFLSEQGASLAAWVGSFQAPDAEDRLGELLTVDGYHAQAMFLPVHRDDDDGIKRAMIAVRYWPEEKNWLAGELQVTLRRSGDGQILVEKVVYDFPGPAVSDLGAQVKDSLEDERVWDFMGWGGRYTPPPDKVIDLAPRDMEFFSDRERILVDFSANRQGLKMQGEDALVDATGWGDARRFQDAWAQSASDYGGEQDWLHVVAYLRAGEPADVQRTKGMDDALRLENDPKWFRGISEKAYNSVKERTQAYFKNKGLAPDDEIVVYRGTIRSLGDYPEMRDVKAGQEIKIKPRPLMSWSLSVETARRFAGSDNSGDSRGFVFGIRVPVKEVFAHFATGMGCATEQEVILEGAWLKDRPVEVIWTSKKR